MRLAIATVIAVLAAGAASAQTVTAAEPRSVMGVLKNAGHAATLTTDDEGWPMIEASVDGINYTIGFYNCEADKTNCLDIYFSSGFDVEPGLTPEWANTWNFDHIIGSAELNEDGDPYITYFVTSETGLPRENFAAVVSLWTQLLGDFADDIDW